MERGALGHARRAGLVVLLCYGVAGWTETARADCTSVNGSALNNLAANDTVNCSGTGSSSLASTNDGITVNLLPGMQQGTGANFANLADSNFFEGSGFYILSGGSVLDAGNANTLHLSGGYLSGNMFGIALQSGNEVWLTDMEIHGGTAALSFAGVTYSVIRNSFIQSANLGLTTGINSIVTATDTVFDTGANAIEAGNGSTVTVTGGSITSATTGIFVGTGASVFLTDTEIESGAVGVRLGNGSQAILMDVDINAAAQGILGLTGFISVRDSTIASTGSAAIVKNGGTTLLNSSISGPIGFTANNVNLTANLTVIGSTVEGSTNSVILSDVADTLTLDTGSALNSPNGAEGGAGVDQILLHGSGAEDEVFTNFETLTMDGTDWSLTGDSTVADIDVQQGRLRVNANIAATNGAVVASTGVIGGSGNLTTPLLDVSGGTAPGNSVGTLTVTGNFLQNGGFMEVEYDESGIDLLNVTGTATLAGAPTLIVKPLSGAGGASGVFLDAAGGLTGTFDAVDFQGNGGATVVYSASQATLFAAQPTGVVAEDTLILGLGEQVLGTIGGQQSYGADDSGRKVWGTGLGFFTSRDAVDGNAGYDADSGGALMGADLYVHDGWRFGLGAGYAHTSIEIDDGAGDSDLNGAFGLAYGGYAAGRWFLNGRVMAGWQDVNASRTIANEDDLSHAASDSDAWLLGAGLSTGMHLDFQDGWRLTPRFNLDYVQQWHGSAHERSAGGGEIDIDDYSTASLTASALLRAGQTYDLQDLTLEPFLQFGVAQRVGLGDRHADASFQDNGDAFLVDLNHDTRTIGIVGTGVVLEFANGVDLEMDYQGNLSADVTEHSVFAKLRATW